MLLRHGDGDTQCECCYCGYSEKPADVADMNIQAADNRTENFRKEPDIEVGKIRYEYADDLSIDYEYNQGETFRYVDCIDD